jgi:hypothetical protein
MDAAWWGGFSYRYSFASFVCFAVRLFSSLASLASFAVMALRYLVAVHDALDPVAQMDGVEVEQ